MDNRSTDNLTSVKNSDEEKKSLSSSMDALPTRRAFRNVSRQTNKSSDVIKQEKVEQKKEPSEEQKENVIDENNEQPKGSLKDKIVNSINYIDAPKKVISNIKHVAKSNKIGVTSIGIAILIVILVIMIFLVFSKDEKDNSLAKYLDNMRAQEVVQCDIEQVNYFFKTYYDALAAGNTTIIEGLFDDPSKANITTGISEIVESFVNIKVYITKGINDQEIGAFVYNELKFPNIDTTAPCVDSFYLKYNALDNSLKIVTDMYTDAKIIKFMNVVAKKEPVRSLISNTNDNLNTALESDSRLKDLYLIMQSMTENTNNLEVIH